jgi:beta-alanine degradation protein BauB
VLMKNDPVATNPELYSVVFENEKVRVLEYRDQPGDRTLAHDHPDSVMITLSSFRRRLGSQDESRDVELTQGLAAWLPAQRHFGANIGDSETHVIFVELKEPGSSENTSIGPVVS